MYEKSATAKNAGAVQLAKARITPKLRFVIIHQVRFLFPKGMTLSISSQPKAGIPARDWLQEEVNYPRSYGRGLPGEKLKLV